MQQDKVAPYETRLEHQARLERRVLKFLTAALALMVLWSVVKVFLPKGHIDALAVAKQLRIGMAREAAMKSLGKPDARDQNFRFCGNAPASYHSVYFDNRNRHRRLRVCYDENDCVDWVQVTDDDVKVLLEVEADGYSHDGF